jgi:hypothetical protein
MIVGRIVPLFLVSTVFFGFIKAQQDGPCDAAFLTSTALADYIDCISSSPGCNDCDAGDDIEPEFSGGGALPSTNDDVELLFCEAVNCCSACTEQSKALLQCTADAVCLAFGITDNCSLECSPEKFPYGDGVSVPDECDVAIGAFTSCLIRDGSCLTSGDEQCLDRLNYLNATTTVSTVANSCTFAEAYFCTYVECCPDCQDELQAVYECEVETNDLSGCELTCADAVSSGINGGSTPAPSPPELSEGAPSTSTPEGSPTNDAPSEVPGSAAALLRCLPCATVAIHIAVAVVIRLW